MSETSTNTPPASSPKPSRLRRLTRRFDRLFVLTVAVPTLAATVYYGAIASDVYISESRFVVRTPQRQMQTGLGALLQGTAFSRSQDDTYSVHDFIRSRDALRELDAKLGFRAAYSADSIDLFNRFGGLGWDKSFEALHRHYMEHVSITYDTVSSISVLRVRAFTPEDSRNINDLLLQMGERLVNNLNIRSREDLIKVAEHEVRLAEDKARAAALALSSFRSTRGVFDPDRQSVLQLQAATRLREELLAAETQLEQVRQVSPNNPQIATLSGRVEALRRALSDEVAKVTGQGGRSLSSNTPAYDRLLLDKVFADRQLTTALTSLESARSEAQRKQLYLERLVQPNLPDKSVEPRRARSVLMVFLLGLVVWGVLSLVVASVREHSD
jgi:capsular polysaccharide transport system permease protein